MSNITFEDFEKVELRTGIVLEAEDHPKADRLLVLKVRIGQEDRQIVAGIRPNYTKETMVNKTIIVCVNLEPRKLRGIESHGMLLAVKNEETLSLLTTDRNVVSGLKVG